MKNIIITGATGMIGGLILDLCLASDKVQKVISLTRRTTDRSHAKLEEVVVEDFRDYSGKEHLFTDIDVAFFCIGVYTGAVPRGKFREITVDYAVEFGKMLKANAPKVTLCFLSGMGADRTEKTKTMFALDKGVAENQLSALDLGAFHTFRPGYIYPVTPRKEPNFSYVLSRKLYPILKMMGKKYSITSEQLAQGIFNVGMKGGTRKEELENEDILNEL